MEFLSKSPTNFTVTQSSLKGEGVVSNKYFNCGDIAFCEIPLYSQQSMSNKNDVLICGFCQGFIGDANLQLQILLRLQNRQTLTNSSHESIISCEHKCGEFYCSTTCMENHKKKCHSLLCTGLLDDGISDTHPLILFKKHAIETNEIFLLVADVFAHMILLHTSNQQPIEQSIDFFRHYNHELWWDVVTIPEDREPEEFRDILKSLVEESYRLLNESLELKNRGLDGYLSEDFFARLIGTFEQNNVGIKLSSPLSQLITQLQPGDPTVSQYLDAANCIIDNLPECEDEECGDDDDDDGDDDDGEDVNDTEMNTQDSKDNNDEDDDEEEKDSSLYFDESTSDNQLNELHALLNQHGFDKIFPPLDGTAFYQHICKINHSCDPNVIVKYTTAHDTSAESMVYSSYKSNIYFQRTHGNSSSSAKALTATVTVLRPIQSGEELVQSYIDNHSEYDARQEALADYGFTCQCSKCVNK